MLTIEELQVLIAANTDQFRGELIKVNEHLSNLNKSAQEGAKNIQHSMDIATKASLFAAGALTSIAIGAKKSINASNELSNAMTGLDTVTAKLGVDQAKARQAAMALSEDGLMPLADSVGGLKNLLASGFGLDEAIALMNGFKDSAAFNRQAALGYGEAIKSATEGIKNQNSVLVDNAGLSKNLSVIIKEQGLSVDDLAKVQSDANVRTKLFNGLMQELSLFTGDATKYAEDFKGEQAKLGSNITKTSAAIGDVLKPQLVGFLRLATQAVGVTGEWIKENQNQVVAITKSAVVVLGLVLAFSGFVKVIPAVVTGIKTVSVALIGLASTNPILLALTIALSALTAGWVTSQIQQAKAADALDDASGAAGKAKDSVDSLTNSNKKLNSSTSEASENVLKTMKLIADEEYNYNKQRAQIFDTRREQFEETKAQLLEEAEIFSSTKRDELEEYTRNLMEMEERYNEFASRTKEQIAEETESFEESSNEKRDKNKETLDKLKQQEQSRLQNLEASLQAGLAMASASNRTQIEQKLEALEREKLVSQAKIDDLALANERELADDQAKHNKKIMKLEQALAKEKEKYDKDVAEKKARFEKETAEQQVEYDKRTTQLTTKLNKDKAFLELHAEEEKTINRGIILDELQELDKSHKEKIAEYQKTLAKQKGMTSDFVYGAGGINSLLDGIKIPTIDLNEAIKFDWKRMFRDALNGLVVLLGWIMDRTVDAGYYLIEGVTIAISAALSKIPKIGDYFASTSEIHGVFNGLRKDAHVGSQLAAKIPKLARGGVVNSPTILEAGEAGAEAIVPLENNMGWLDKLAEKINNVGFRGGNQNNWTINNYGNELNEEQLAGEVLFRMKML